MAAATRPSPAFTLFEGFVTVHGLAVRPGEEWDGEEWAAVRCASKAAYRCGGGAFGQQLADGLTLYVRRAAAAHPELLTSFLSIVLSDAAASGIAAELGFPRKGLEAMAEILIAHRQAIVLLLIFRYNCINRCFYYIAYDSADASLSVTPYLPRQIEAIYTSAPVPVRGAGGGDLALVLMARLVCTPDVVRSRRLCVCAPADGAAAGGAWREKVHVFPKLYEPFSADVVFSLHGTVFWADLSQGVAYSDLDAGGNAAVDTVFVSLPDGHRIEYYPQQKDLPLKMRRTPVRDPAKMSRTMGCVEDAVKFVCIDDGHDPGNETAVKVLTLDLDRRVWEEDEGLSCPWNDLWEQVVSMNAELRDVEPLEPQYPTLMPDGALFLLLPIVPEGGHPMDGNYYVCGFDMRSKSLRCFGQVHKYHTLSPVILPSDFFSCSPPPAEGSCQSAKYLEADVQSASR